MGVAEASIEDGRIRVTTRRTRGENDFAFMLAASKKVNGGAFTRHPAPHWHYPLTVATCKALRLAFGERLVVMEDLAQWYINEEYREEARIGLSYLEEATLSERVPAAFAKWLRGYQRVGAKWIAAGHEGCGLVADHPGLGKTPETLAALLEADVRGPVLVVCPKASVRSVWGVEARRHLKGVPVYLCRGNREKRQAMLALFAKHMAEDPERLRIVVVVAEMLRVKLGDPCYTWVLKDPDAESVPGEWLEDGTYQVNEQAIVYKNKISGMCKQRRKSLDGKCRLHVQKPAKSAKDKVPVDFEYPQLFDEHLLGGGWSWVILDEAHKLLGSLMINKANLMGRGLRLLPEAGDANHKRRRYALTGTPWGKGGRLQGMFGVLHWLWPEEHTSFWKWVKSVFETEEKVIGYDRRTGPKTALNILGPKGLAADATPAQDLEHWENWLASLGPRILRRTKGEMLKDLPPKSYAEVACEMSPAQRKQFKEMADWAEISTPGGPILANGYLALRMRSQQLANGALCQTIRGKPVFTQDSGKLDQLWEKLDARGIIDGVPGFKLVVASRFTEFLDAIATMLTKDKVDYYRLDGGTSEARRTEIMEAWQQGIIGPRRDCRVLLINTKAAGISINLDAADEMHMMDEDPDPGVNEQVEDRIHRASRNHPVTVFYYRTIGTVDYEAARNVEYRRRLQHAVMDGRRGVSDDRKESELLALVAEAVEVE
jgi:SNF2 family DNA or RNA helicase